MLSSLHQWRLDSLGHCDRKVPEKLQLDRLTSVSMDKKSVFMFSNTTINTVAQRETLSRRSLFCVKLGLHDGSVMSTGDMFPERTKIKTVLFCQKNYWCVWTEAAKHCHTHEISLETSRFLNVWVIRPQLWKCCCRQWKRKCVPCYVFVR